MDKKRRLPDGGQAAEEAKVQPWGGQIKTTMDLMEKKLTGKGSAVGGVNQWGIGGGTLRAVGA